MQRLGDLLGTAWLPAVCVALAAALLALRLAAPVRRRAGLRVGVTALGLALFTLGAGGLMARPAVPEADGSEPALAGWPLALLAGVGAAWVLALAVLAVFRAWSFWVGTVLGVGLGVALGAVALRPLGGALRESVGSVRGVQFVRPEWLALLLLVPLVYLISRRSLSGLEPSRRFAAIGLRTLGLALLALALAEPRLRRPTDSATVLFVIDRSFSVPQDVDPNRPASDAVDRRWETVKNFVETAVARRPASHADDQSGLILFGRRPKLALPPALVAPGQRMPVDERLAGPIDGTYTDIAAALKMALASFPEGSGKRVVLISDGNENLGLAEEQASLAKKNGVEIDTIALAPGFRNENEILVQTVEAPAVVAKGQRLPVRVLIRNATPDRVVDGRLDLVKKSTGQSVPVEIEDSPQVLERGNPPKVRLTPGLNVFRFRNQVDGADDQSFTLRAIFTPTEARPLNGGPGTVGLPGDRVANNTAEAAVVARGQRRVLLLDDNDPDGGASPHEYFLRTMRFDPPKPGQPAAVRLRVDRLAADALPKDSGELSVFLSNYDAVVLANTPYERFAEAQAEVIRSAVYDQGCGLIMVGGPDSFGAGGYQDTPIEKALPVDCEIKALKAAGRGGLVLIMHASEMADGNKWQKDIAKLAIQRLGPADMVGVVQYSGFGGGAAGVLWHIPFTVAGEQDGTTRRNLLAKVDALSPGDMPDFDPFLVAAYDTLSDPKYALSVKHAILISDGDPNYSGPGMAAVKKMAEGQITCTTVGVATHGGAEKSRLKLIAEGTMDGAGKKGNFYDVTDPRQLPAIYIKESRRVSQSFLYKEPFTPAITGASGSSEVLAPGLPNPLPPLQGFVRTTKKQNVLATMSLQGPSLPDQVFPVLASWRYGLGKAVAFTSDIRTQPEGDKQFWDRDWVKSDMYRKFWEQTLNWAMREPERGQVTLTTEYREGRVRVTADVRDKAEKPLSGVTVRGSMTTPKPGEKLPTLEFRAKGNGLYEAEMSIEEAGTYLLNVQALAPERDAAGGIQRNPDGTVRMAPVDSARVGVSVPYSPEFADLESNPALLKRLSDITGGRHHTEAEAELQELLETGDLFRDAPVATRALLPFWFWLVFAAALALLCDVAIRRISLETAEVAAGAAGWWRRLRVAEAAGEAAHLDRLTARKRAAAQALDRGRATRRFEPGATAEAAPEGADAYAERMAAAPPPPKAASDRAAPAPAEDADDPLTRLRKAKERAREQQRRDRGE